MTEYQNSASAERSRAITRAQRGSSVIAVLPGIELFSFIVVIHVGSCPLDISTGRSPRSGPCFQIKERISRSRFGQMSQGATKAKRQPDLDRKSTRLNS